VRYKVTAKSLRAFGQNVSRLRREAGLSQDALARKADLTKRYIQSIESGTRSTTLTTLKRLQGALNCRYDDLLSGF
jgi:transcriptional regulator with XRE-family HTH domain